MSIASVVDPKVPRCLKTVTKVASATASDMSAGDADTSGEAFEEVGAV